jgi:hypothetical protein
VKKIVAVLATVAVVASAVTAALIWRLTRDPEPKYPEISAYTHGQLARVGPFRYCAVLELTKCDVPGSFGELVVTSRNPVQLSVPPSISRAPWVLLRVYEGSDDLIEGFPPNTKLAVTIPTVDPHRGRLTGIAVQLPTLVRDEAGNEFPLPHAEWSVRTVWS